MNGLPGQERSVAAAAMFFGLSNPEVWLNFRLQHLA